VPVRLITDALDGVEGKYTHEIIVDLKSNPEYEVYQLCGTDGFTSIKERVIGQNEKFIISKRAGYEIPANILENSNLYFIDEEKDFQGISSTKIREMIKNGDDQYKKLLPNLITDYIEDKGLYKTKVS
jgi:nicotinic acid mononucleotide adenylyltransferase